MFCIKFRIPIIIILIGVTIFLGFGLKKLTKENGVEALLPTDNREYLFFKSMEKQFGATDQIVLGITFPDSVYTVENLSLVQDFSNFLMEDESIEEDDVLSLSTIENIDGIDQELIIESIIPEDKEITNIIGETAKLKVRDNAMLKDKIVSKDEKSTAIIMTVNTDISMNAEKLAVVINRINKQIVSIKDLRPDLVIYRSGMVSVKLLPARS